MIESPQNVVPNSLFIDSLKYTTGTEVGLNYGINRKMNPTIEYTEWGLANTVVWGSLPKIIRMNKNLVQYPKLHDEILAHEIAHFEQRGFMHLFSDLKDMFRLSFQLSVFWFMVKHPQSLYELSPLKIWCRENRIEVNFCLTPILFFSFLALMALSLSQGLA